MDNQKNLLLAVVFSLVILIGFDFFFAPKKSEINKVQVNENISEETLDKNTPSIDSSLVKSSYSAARLKLYAYSDLLSKIA